MAHGDYAPLAQMFAGKVANLLATLKFSADKGAFKREYELGNKGEGKFLFRLLTIQPDTNDSCLRTLPI